MTTQDIMSRYAQDTIGFADARDQLARIARVTENPEPLAQLYKAHRERDAKRSAQGLL